ncbi:Deoxypodophyllotoxin synthase [Cardamine amara subsp. amara]|uniref:Deoxypodophyllotoxin synthase n=1 Tax=Cardamine amara subsp. amara TaxID=228776 RepID=A0ABD0ZLE5_CARAN
MHGFSLREDLGIENAMNNEETQRFTHFMWPQGNDRFCETVRTYSNAAVKLDQVLVRMIFENYGMEKHYDSHMESVTYLLRFLKYLPPPESIPTLALPQHTDSAFLSILHYNDVNGLEVKLKTDEWITMHIPPKSYFVLAGDIAKAWSNDRIHSCEHRVAMAGDKIRYTLAVFSYVKGMISVPEELVDEEHPLMYKPFDNLALIKFNATKEGREAKSLKAFCGI